VRSVFSRSNNELYIVMRRGALRSIVGTACSAVVLALAAGLALGHGSAKTPPPVRPEPPKPSAASLYTAGELARLQAANALLDARVGKLASQLDTLSAFDERLRAKTPRTASSNAIARSRASAGDAEGGPELPPRSCPPAGANSNPQHTDAELDCLADTIATLEDGTARHEAAWNAFPGRRPLAPGRISSPFGNRFDPFTHHLSFHPGMDLVAPAGTPILAAGGGKVIYAGPMTGYGNTVDIDNGNGYVTRYAHASKIEVRVGQNVQPGQLIARVGSTGRSTGPHLHFEVRVGDRAVDPAAYLALFAGASNA
jgi:murein DD-endopeptidase MepM/ murein hydrolase activator NlpD